jgi:hypothetical protein
MRLSPSLRIRQIVLPTAHHAGNGCTKNGRQPEQPELREIGSDASDPIPVAAKVEF